MEESVDGFESLADVGRGAVTVFGSARVQPDSELYQLGEEVGKASTEAGYAAITGRGPGLVGAASKDAHENGGFLVNLGIELSHEQGMSQHTDLDMEFRYSFVRKTMSMRYA